MTKTSSRLYLQTSELGTIFGVRYRIKIKEVSWNKAGIHNTTGLPLCHALLD